MLSLLHFACWLDGGGVGVVVQDEGRSVAREVKEVFRQRKDKLQERRSWPLKDTTWEVLGPGARGALKQATLVKGQRRDLLFYHQVSAPHPFPHPSSGNSKRQQQQRQLQQAALAATIAEQK